VRTDAVNNTDATRGGVTDSDHEDYTREKRPLSLSTADANDRRFDRLEMDRDSEGWQLLEIVIV